MIALAFGCALIVQSPAVRSGERVAESTERFQLENGLRVVLHPLPDATAAVVIIGIRAGVHDEPEGQSGLAHLAEHLFLHGGTASAPAGAAFDLLAEGGASGQPYADVNAETLWDLTYAYALRRPGEVEPAITIFAEKLGGVRWEEELLEIERGKALEEIAQVERMMESRPDLRAQAEAFARRPKAGIAQELGAIASEDLDAFLAAHYRPDRALLLVEGAFDPAAVRALVRERFGPLRPGEADSLADRLVEGAPQWARFCVSLGPQAAAGPAALALAAAWKRALDTQGRAFVELAPSGVLRGLVRDGDPARIRASWKELEKPLSDKELRRVLQAAGAPLRQFRDWSAQPLPAATGSHPAPLALAQRALYRLRFEAAGGEAGLAALQELEAQELADLARRGTHQTQ
jgi:hypothetical protein